MTTTTIKPLKQLAQLGLTALLACPLFANIAEASHKEWYCKVSAFTNTYDAIGKSKAEAKLAAIQKCTAENHQMHCENIECEGPDVSADSALNDDENSNTQHGWICKLTAFNKDYAASGNTRAKARVEVINTCKMHHNKMFCENPTCEQG